jgi:hypothetical protein
MSKHKWMHELRIADLPLIEPVQIRAAHSNGPHAQQRLAGSRKRLRLVVQLQLAGRVQARDPH